MPQQLAGSTAQNQEARRAIAAVGQHPQRGKQIRTTLDFIDDHQSFQRSKRRHGLIQTCQADGVLQVEVIHRVRVDQLAGQRGLPALAGSGQNHDVAAPKSLIDLVQ